MKIIVDNQQKLNKTGSHLLLFKAVLMFAKPKVIIIFCLLLFGVNSPAQNNNKFLGIKLRPEIQAIVNEIQKKTGQKIYAIFDDFVDQESTLGESFISQEDGRAYMRVRSDFEEQNKKLEAIIAHELLHLQLRARGFPVFQFSPTVRTSKGLAIDVEQSNVNDLLSLIEHRVFKPEMDKFGFNDAVDLTEEAIQKAKESKGELDGQAQYINYCRAVLEFKNPKDLERLRAVFIENKWQKAIKVGTEMAQIIIQTNINTPAQVESVFSRCLIKLYSAPRPFKFRHEAAIKPYRLIIINT